VECLALRDPLLKTGYVLRCVSEEGESECYEFSRAVLRQLILHPLLLRDETRGREIVETPSETCQDHRELALYI
jgi:hypothetical protein